MRALVPLLLCSSALAAQAVERADVSRPGQLRITFDPTITIWDREYTPAGRVPIGASLPATLFVHAERRITPLTAELGLADRVSLQLFLPLVRAMVRARLPPDSSGAALDSLLADSTYGFAPVANTPNRLRYFVGDFEIAAKLRLAGRAAVAGDGGTPYAATLATVVRLPTGHLNSPNDLFAIPSGDHQTALEGRLTQELTVAGHLWLNLSIRAARQLGGGGGGTRARRVGPEDVLLLPRATLATLAWKSGNSVAVDFAPLLRLHQFFGAGPTLSYFTKQRDRYTFLSAQDSTALAARLGAPRSASVLDAGTSQRRLRLGWAMSYLGPGLEAGMSVEQTVSGAGGRVPATTVFRLVLRTWRKVF